MKSLARPAVLASVLLLCAACSGSTASDEGATQERGGLAEPAALVDDAPSTAYDEDQDLELAFIDSEVRRIFGSLSVSEFRLACDNWWAMDSAGRADIAVSFVDGVLGGVVWVTETEAGIAVVDSTSVICS